MAARSSKEPGSCNHVPTIPFGLRCWFQSVVFDYQNCVKNESSLGRTDSLWCLSALQGDRKPQWATASWPLPSGWRSQKHPPQAPWQLYAETHIPKNRPDLRLILKTRPANPHFFLHTQLYPIIGLHFGQLLCISALTPTLYPFSSWTDCFVSVPVPMRISAQDSEHLCCRFFRFCFSVSYSQCLVDPWILRSPFFAIFFL